MDEGEEGELEKEGGDFSYLGSVDFIWEFWGLQVDEGGEGEGINLGGGEGGWRVGDQWLIV